MFTTDNTEGFSASEIAAMNAELTTRLNEMRADGADEDTLTQAMKSISDEICNR